MCAEPGPGEVGGSLPYSPAVSPASSAPPASSSASRLRGPCPCAEGYGLPALALVSNAFLVPPWPRYCHWKAVDAGRIPKSSAPLSISGFCRFSLLIPLVDIEATSVRPSGRWEALEVGEVREQLWEGQAGARCPWEGHPATSSVFLCRPPSGAPWPRHVPCPGRGRSPGFAVVVNRLSLCAHSSRCWRSSGSSFSSTRTPRS